MRGQCQHELKESTSETTRSTLTSYKLFIACLILSAINNNTRVITYTWRMINVQKKKDQISHAACTYEFGWTDSLLLAVLKRVRAGHQPMLLLTGPPGCGKTACLHVLSKEMGFSILEWVNPDLEGGRLAVTGKVW